MNSVYKRLSERIRDDIPDMEDNINLALQAWRRSQEKTEESKFYIDSVALNLMSFYSGVERIFELIARYVDGRVPKGESWHYNLLWQMTKDVVNVRPSVITFEITTMMDELRGFRNVAHNIYSAKLEPERMVKMISFIPELWKNLRIELLAFADFLDELSDQSEGNMEANK